jgi:NCS1 family nucleobase:cation symporter-1
LINVVGFAGASAFATAHFWLKLTICYLAGRTVPIAATRIYEMSFFTGFGVSSLIYCLLNVVFPVPGKYANFEEVDLSKYEGSVGEDERDADSKKDSAEEETV